VERAAATAPVGWRRWLASGRGRWLGIILSIAFGAALLLPDPGPLAALRLVTFDTYQAWMPRKPSPDAHVTVVEIDDDSLNRVGQWPWPRDVLARLIDRIAAYGPRAIALDLLLMEPDRSSPERVAATLRRRDSSAAEQLARLRPNDDILAESIARAPVVLGIAPANPLERSRPGAPPLLRFEGAVRNLPLLDDAARGHGVISAEPERGILRRLPLVAYVGNDPVLTLGLEALRIAEGAATYTISHADGLVRLQIGRFSVPAQADGRAWIHFARRDDSRFVSAADLLDERTKLDGNVSEALERGLRGKIAMIGVTALAIPDRHTTPLGDQLPGIEIHAQMLDSVFEEATLTRPSWTRVVEAIAFLLAAMLIVFSVPRMRPRGSFAVLLACCAVLAFAGIGGYKWARILFDPTAAIAGMTLLYGLMLSATLVGLDLQRRELSARLALEREAAARVTGELEAARRIQTGMLPTRETVLRTERRIELFAQMSPAREVGGDLYDFFRLPDERFLVLEGDVSGKGLPAAMFMAVAKALAKSAALRDNSGPAALMTAVNEELSRENPEQMFVTMAVLVIDLRTGDLAYCNAGHEPPILTRRSGDTILLDDGGGPPLCVMEDFPYEEARVRLEPRDVLVLASDGFTEAMNREGALYGRERLRALLESPVRRGVDPTVLGNELIAAIKAFEAGAEPSDDQTLLLVSWRGAIQ
jgi:serine phosphatase RsbU (regulator of sigma subunit)/CHASE2 domain-containing sensor protein